MLFTQNPELAKSVHGKDLCLARTLEAGKDANISPLYLLSITDEGKKILKTLLVENPELINSISADALCLKRTPEAGTEAETSPLTWLLLTPNGIEILDILKKNSSLARIITKYTYVQPSLSKTGLFSKQDIESTEVTESSSNYKEEWGAGNPGL